MIRLRAVIVMAALGLACLVGSGASQDKKETKVKGYLPPGWKGLGLSKEQAAKISDIHNTYNMKVKALQDQITEAKKDERVEMVKLLTAEQKKKLVDIVVPDEAPKKEAAAKVEDPKKVEVKGK